jgi:hypothetical protein
MSAEKNSQTLSSFSRAQMRIIEHIDRNVDDMEYMKSKRIAESLDNMSAKQVGTNMRRISSMTDRFSIEVWGNSTGVTWMIERTD